MSVPSVIDFKFAEEESELPDFIRSTSSGIDLEEEEILETVEPELIKFEEKEKIVHDDIFDSVAGGPKGTVVKKEKKEDILEEPLVEKEPPKKEKK